jgi:hypothetical protein
MSDNPKLQVQDFEGRSVAFLKISREQAENFRVLEQRYKDTTGQVLSRLVTNDIEEIFEKSKDGAAYLMFDNCREPKAVTQSRMENTVFQRTKSGELTQLYSVYGDVLTIADVSADLDVQKKTMKLSVHRRIMAKISDASASVKDFIRGAAGQDVLASGLALAVFAGTLGGLIYNQEATKQQLSVSVHSAEMERQLFRTDRKRWKATIVAQLENGDTIEILDYAKHKHRLDSRAFRTLQDAAGKEVQCEVTFSKGLIKRDENHLMRADCSQYRM